MKSRVIAAISFVLAFFPAAFVSAAPPPATISTAFNSKSLPVGQKAMLAIVVEVPEGLHAQSHTPSESNYIPFTITFDSNPAVKFSEPIYPAGKIETYPALGKLNVYTGKVVFIVPLQVNSDAPAGPIKVTGQMRYQMCNDKVCFFPQTTKFEAATQIVAAGSATEPNQPELFPQTTAATTSQPAASTQTVVTESAAGAVSIDLLGWEVSLGKDAYLLTFFCAFIVGIVFNVMPCVLPVVPLKAMGFYEVSQHKRSKSLALGLVFSLGLVASFAVLGLLVFALHWIKWGQMFSNTWFLLILVLVLVVMAISMFGVFTVNVPTAVYRFAPRHDTYTGNFLFGILTAALSTPCTFGMFFGLLAWAVAQPVAIGVLLMIVVGMGMAFPYVVLSAFPELARKLPRTGAWAETIKMLLGFLLLGTAAYFGGPFINRALGEGKFWWVIFIIALAAAVFLVVRTFKYSPGTGARVAAVIVAILMVAPTFYVVQLLTARPYEWKPYTADALASAQKEGRIVLVDFTADWCGNCHALEAFVLNSRRVVKTVDENRVVMLKADVSNDNAPGRPLLNQLNPVGAIPLTVIYAPGMTEPIQLTGIYKVRDLQDAIAKASRS